VCIVEQLVEFSKTFAGNCYLESLLLHKPEIIPIHLIHYMTFYDQSGNYFCSGRLEVASSKYQHTWEKAGTTILHIYRFLYQPVGFFGEPAIINVTVRKKKFYMQRKL